MKLPAPLANGLRTDHPVPGLPFVDDSILPLDDRRQIEKIGRGRGKGMWGREDVYRPLTEHPQETWRAFTTDPTNTDFAWLVISHPTQGKSVLLYKDEDVVRAYSYQDYENEGITPLVVRAGGYWSDGETWVRPTLTKDPVTHTRTWDEVPDAQTVTADSALALTGGVGTTGVTYTLTDVARGNAPMEPYATWVARSLSAWAEAREPGSLAMSQSVVTVEAPELDQKHLMDNTEAAGFANVEPSTWRAYVSRGTAPSPQYGWLGEDRPRWSLPILQAWVARKTHDEERGVIVSDVDEYTEPAIDQISESITRLGRKPFKTGNRADAIRFALERNIVGLATHDHIPAAMHASWLVDEFSPDLGGNLPNIVGDQIVSFMWLNPFSAEHALQGYVAKGIERGYSRTALEHALLNIPQVRGSREYTNLVSRAISPQWGN